MGIHAAVRLNIEQETKMRRML